VIRKAAQETHRDRIKAAIGVITLHSLIGYALITTLGIEIPPTVRNEFKLFEIRPEPPPAPAEKHAARRAKREKSKDAASPPNLKAKASEVVAPAPEVRPIIPPPIVAAPTPGLGNAPFSGASNIPGRGMGSGGQGTGTGGGGNGDDDGEEYTPPEWLRGRIRDSDYPRAAGEAGIGKTIVLQFDVETNGRVSGCKVIESSGNAILDDATCRLVEKRYRYEPSRDAQGIAVPSAVVESHIWLSGEH
jgi:protein TonB